MKINIGSQNKSKVEALKEILLDYPHLAHAEIFPISTDSGVANQPKSLDETMQGAINRAKGAWKDCDYSVGLESGLMHVSMSKTGYMDVCVCAIYDGKEFHFGLSSAWEFPDKKILDLILKDGLDMSEAINRAGLTNNPKIGSEQGAIGILTKGRMDRKEYTKQALRTALIHLEQE
jgi:inosine/xanthosine triphosphatase